MIKDKFKEIKKWLEDCYDEEGWSWEDIDVALQEAYSLGIKDMKEDVKDLKRRIKLLEKVAK